MRSYELGAGITEKVSRHAVNPSMGAQHRHPVGDGLETFSAIPAVPSELHGKLFWQIKTKQRITP